MRAPGSSANLGPGFDVLGLAVARYVWANDEGRGELCWDGHIARDAFEAAGGSGELWFEFDLEPGRGLGFSAAARAAGAYLAYRQGGAGHDEAQLHSYDLVNDIEGHGDNAAPCVYGGMHVIAGDTQHRIGAKVPGRMLFWIPEIETSTDESRSTLEPVVDRADAVFNLGRLGLLLSACYEQRIDLLRTATEDRLHQSSRLANSELTAKAYEAAYQSGASAVWLSGSGPTLAIVATDDAVGPISSVLGESGAVRELALDAEGVVVAQ